MTYVFTFVDSARICLTDWLSGEIDGGRVMPGVIKFQPHCAVSRVLRPKTAGSTVVSLFASSSKNSRESSGGIRPRDFQFESADGPTPAKRCAVSLPSASMTDSTEVRTITPYSSRGVNMSSDHDLAIEREPWNRDNAAMPIARKTLPKRLRLTLDALEATQAEVSRATGLKPNRLSQYLSGERDLTLDAAVKICDAYGVTLDWLFLADPSNLPAKLHSKLASTEVA